MRTEQVNGARAAHLLHDHRRIAHELTGLLLDDKH